MLTSFQHIIRGSFILSDLNIYHKKQFESEWNFTHNGRLPDPSDISYFGNSGNRIIQYFQNEKYIASVVLPLADKSYLGILIGPKLGGSEFSDFDKITLQILLQVFDNAYKSFLNQKKEKELIFELNEKVVQLNNLVDTVIEISRFENRDQLFNIALERMSSLTNASSSSVQISRDGQQISVYTFPQNLKLTEIADSEYKIQSSFVHNNLTYNFTLAEKETRIGVSGFNELDKLLFNAIVRQVNASIENQYLNEQAIEKEKIEQELTVAASIQQRIIPEKLPSIEGYELAGINIPSREVGGDYFDCIDLGNGKFALIIADVAGKGIGAALLVSTLNAALYSYLQFDISPTEIADRLNKLIYKSSPSDKYITFFIAVLDSNSGTLDVVNAGHNPIFLLRKNGSLEKIDAGGVGLGMFDFGIPFKGQNTIMNSGDILFLYTDGIPEAMNTMEEEYSDEKMIDFFVLKSEKSAIEIVDELVQDVKVHSGKAPQSDDITMMILKKN